MPQLWVVANYKETQLTSSGRRTKGEDHRRLLPGTHAAWAGARLVAGDRAQFALLPPDNATGNFTKVVQRMAVKIGLDDADGLTDRLVPGMSVEAKVDARDGKR